MRLRIWSMTNAEAVMRLDEAMKRHIFPALHVIQGQRAGHAGALSHKPVLCTFKYTTVYTALSSARKRMRFRL
jgi:hypothetical protein